MATLVQDTKKKKNTDLTQQALMAGQRRARQREAMLGILFVAPATLAMLIFGLYPVLYGFFISMQGGIVIPEGFIGLDNYFQALGSLAFLLSFAIALVLVVVGYRLFRTPFAAMLGGQGDFYRYLIPAFIAAPATLALLGLFFSNNLAFAATPLVLLIIALALYGYLETRQHSGLNYIVGSWGAVTLILAAVFLVLFTLAEMSSMVTPTLDVFRKTVSYNKYIVPLEWQFAALGIAVLGVMAAYGLQRVRQQLDRDRHPGRLLALAAARWLMIAVVVGTVVYITGALELLRGTLSAFGRVSPDKLAALTSAKPADLVRQALIWPQVFTILLGISLIGLAYTLWSSATRRQTTPGMLGTFGIAILLMVGGWLFIGELPNAAASGDAEFYLSLLRTATYSVATVPVQLGLGLLLAYLLFHEVTVGKSFFRIVYFVPYIAPTVATATVFAVIFSLRPESPANQFMQLLGLPPQQWLRDNRGIFEIIVQTIGGRQTQLPSFLVGPTLPLTAAIIYSIWVFSGYNAVIFLAGLGTVPREMYEAAEVDGAGRWANFRHITIPLISPTTFFLTILAIIGTFKAFDHIYVLRTESARGAMDTATVYIYNLIRQGSQPWSYASAASFVLFGIILVLTLIQTRLSRDQVFYG